MRILGLDPGLRHTGWGLIEKNGSSYVFIAAGVINPDPKGSLATRLAVLHTSLTEIIETYHPSEVGIEETFVNKNPNSTLKLGQARGVVLCVPGLFNIPTYEYPPNHVKKMIVGAGHATKDQVDLMIRKVLKNIPHTIPPDVSDALAIALCHGFNSQYSTSANKALISCPDLKHVQ